MTAAAAFDERTTLARPDLAEQALEGVVRASAYRAVRSMHGNVGIVDIHAGIDPASGLIDQLLFGEAFDVLDQNQDRAWGRARRDGVVGWIDFPALSPGAPRAACRVASVSAALPLNALVMKAPPGMTQADLAPIGTFERDPVAVAERLLGVPHQLGARSSVATDCSGLVQQALYACGLPGPRRSDEQAGLGVAVEPSQARRGDIVIWLSASPDHSWTGHSAVMTGADRVIHATGFHGAVAVEAFAEADARCRAEGFAAPLFRRPIP